MLSKINIAQAKRIAIVATTILLLVTTFAFYKTLEIKFDYNIENFFSSNNPDLNYYNNYTKHFENDNDFILVGLKNADGIFRQNFLERIEQLTISLEKLNHVTHINSPTNLKKTITSPLGTAFKLPIIQLSQPQQYQKDAEKIFSTDDYFRSFFSTDKQAISIFIKKNENTTPKQNEELLAQIKNKLQVFGFSKYHLAGRINTQNYYISAMQREMLLFGLLSLSLLVLFLLISFRNLFGIVIPFLVLGISLLATFGIMVLAGQNIHLMLTILPTLLFVIGISNCVHLLSKFLDEIRAGKDSLTACLTTIKETGFATLITSITTAAGFFMLIFVPIKPIQTFGFYVGIGVLITYLISILLFPSIFVLLPKRYFLGKSTTYQPRHLIGNLFLWIVKNPKKTMICTGLFIAVSLLGIQNISINNYFLDDLNSESDLKKDLLFFENNFAGIRPFEMGIHLSDSSQNIFSLKVLKEIDKLEEFLKETYGVGAIFSPLTIIKMANQSLNGGKIKEYKLPHSQENINKIIRQLKISGKLSKLNNIITSNLKMGRLTGRTHDLGNAAFHEKNKMLSRFLVQNIDKNIVWVKQTGAATLMDQTNRSIAVNLTKGLVAAFILIAIIVGVLFRSVKMALISLVPNMLPLLVIAGLMGFAGIDLKVGTSLIFTIAFGIAVDDTIHLLSKLKLELKKGRGPIHALKNALNTCGKAISLTTFILSSGFLIFLFSEFSSTFFIGLLISIALILALLADFFILPVLIILSNYGKNK